MDDGVEERLLVAEENGSSHLKTRIWRETKLIWRIAFPAIITRVTSFGLIVVTQSFLGHVDAIDLAAYALVQSIILRFFDGILVITKLLLSTYIFENESTYMRLNLFLFILEAGNVKCNRNIMWASIWSWA